MRRIRCGFTSLAAFLSAPRPVSTLLLRQGIFTSSCYRNFSFHASAQQDEHDPRMLASSAFSVMAKRSRTWKRLRHLVDLACDDCENLQTIADIGCDHGLLAMGLAVSGRFDHVVGVDLSDRALQNGALPLYRQLVDKSQAIHPLEFRVGNGLHALQNGEADVLCIAGMGINIMMQILSQPEMERVGCRRLVLQPTNCRPRNLMRLYDGLQNLGWSASEERIESLSSRWYMSTSFERGATGGENPSLPGQLLSPTSSAYHDYVCHHKKWIERDLQKGHEIHEDDQRWFAAVANKWSC